VLTEKPWRFDAVLRLGLAVFLCQFLGGLALAAARFSPDNARINVSVFIALVAGCVISCGAALLIIRKPWEFENFTRQFILLIFFVYLGLTLGAFVQHYTKGDVAQSLALRAITSAFCLQGATLLLLPFFLREHRETWSSAFGLRYKPGIALLFGFLAACAFLPIGEILQRACLFVIVQLKVKPEVQSAVEALTSAATTFDKVALGFTTIVLAPIAEEILFRGILYPLVKRAGYPKLALFGTAIIFAAIHVNLVIFIPLFVLALLLTFLYERTGNLLAPIVAHSVFNLLNFIYFLIIESQQTPPV
jgi:membrane protease YdiL (CAAX protease family)